MGQCVYSVILWADALLKALFQMKLHFSFVFIYLCPIYLLFRREETFFLQLNLELLKSFQLILSLVLTGLIQMLKATASPV